MWLFYPSQRKKNPLFFFVSKSVNFCHNSFFRDVQHVKKEKKYDEDKEKHDKWMKAKERKGFFWFAQTIIIHVLSQTILLNEIVRRKKNAAVFMLKFNDH